MGPLGPAAAAVTAARLLLDRRPGLGTARQGVVDGPSGSGKSTFARMWEEQIRAAAVPVTGVSSDVLATWDDAFDWWSRFDTGVLGRLARRVPGRIRVTDWASGSLVRVHGSRCRRSPR